MKFNKRSGAETVRCWAGWCWGAEGAKPACWFFRRLIWPAWGERLEGDLEGQNGGDIPASWLILASISCSSADIFAHLVNTLRDGLVMKVARIHGREGSDCRGRVKGKKEDGFQVDFCVVLDSWKQENQK